MNKAIDVELNVKPVFIQLVHTTPLEGPCQPGSKEEMGADVERRMGREGIAAFDAKLKENTGSLVRVMEPTYLEWSEDWVLPEAQVRSVEPDIYEADLVAVSESGLPQLLAATLAARYRRPIGMLGWVPSVDVAAYLRSRGYEGYGFMDYGHLRQGLALLQVRKAFQRTRVPMVQEGTTGITAGVVSAIDDMATLQPRYGVHTSYISASTLLRVYDDLDEEGLNSAELLTTQLMENAEAVHMSRENLLPSVRFYVAVRKALERYECNAFVIPCAEVCATRVLGPRRVMFCLAHSLLKDEGIPSACEGDTNVLMSIALLEYISRKSAYMGNVLLPNPPQDNVIAVGHDIPGLRMKGLAGRDYPYQIKSFTFSGWGATLRYDFARDVGDVVTLVRFDPTGSKVLAVRGEIVGCEGVTKEGCSLRAHVRVNDLRDFYVKSLDFGHHMAMAYGDYLAQVKELGKMMGFGVVEA